ncbi:MAG: transglutaminase family protein, partial [Ekhidna sp.]|nr:transglutaminase family protein [Ekhidna sp.]
MDPSFIYRPSFSEQLGAFLTSTDFIQSEDAKITELASELSRGKNHLLEIIGAFYDFVYQMPNSSTSELTDALMALEQREASCNGKSRLLVALCRSLRIPARIVGGLIMEETAKKTSHSWVEIWVDNTWIPFDALNGHFASLPAHYLELYRGDHFLLKHTQDIHFDYLYVIEKERVHDYPAFAALNIWELIDE